MRNKNMLAMEVILELLCLGLGRIEVSKTMNFAEFCFQGLRYPCTDRDWRGLIETIGYKKIAQAISKVTL